MAGIQHISDTARWVAFYRAMETDRPDAIFRDPFARRLAGAQGEAIVGALPRGHAMAWAMIVRTRVFDEMILEVVTRGATRVVNLAAGLDARPWRLPLPPTLQWVDVDLPDMLAYKANALRDARPVCRYDAVPADLTQPVEREALTTRLRAIPAPTLVVTEGLLIYLTRDQVGTLATGLHALPDLNWWLIDLASPRLLHYMERYWGRALRAGQAPFQFAPAEGTAFFETFGWWEAEFRPAAEEAHRLRREMRNAWMWRLLARLAPPARREEFRRMSGFVRLERGSATASAVR
jgi:methyltransferase (TIGR00027 family)